MKTDGAIIAKYSKDNRIESCLKVDARYENRYRWTSDLNEVSIFDSIMQAEQFKQEFLGEVRKVYIKEIVII